MQPSVTQLQKLVAQRYRVNGPEELPLYNLDNKFAVFWSHKSACTSTVIWFTGTLGRLEEAHRFHVWPHQWRMQVYQNEPKWYQAALSFDASWRVLRVIRDPFSRAISIYRHVLFHGLDAQRLSAFLGRETRSSGFSFVEFLRFLAASKIDELNAHVRPQRKSIEPHLRIDRVINVSRQDLFTELNGFERDLGLPETDFAQLHWLHEVEQPRKVNRIDFDGDVASVRLTPIFAKNGSDWPGNDAFLTDETRQLIRQIYAADFAAYGPYL